jgi:hypothetical protein
MKTGLVFDDKLWNYKDVGDNSQFWKVADILEDDGETATVRFHHDGRISRGHFLSAMRRTNDPN